MWILFAAWAMTGTGLMIALLLFMCRASRARRWPRATGVLLQGPRLRIEGDGESYEVFIKYRYTVNGVEYVSDRIRMIEISTGFKHHAHRLLVQVQALVRDGRHIEVRYNPKNPAQAVLIPGFPPLYGIGIILLGTATIAGLAWAAYATRS